LRGRTWGPARNNNPFRRSNIIIALGTEVVSIVQDESGKLIINQMIKTENTSLGEEVKKILAIENIKFQ
jgi:hypothetical protein